MTKLSKPKFRISTQAPGRGANGYSWDNGIAAFGNPLEKKSKKGKAMHDYKLKKNANRI